MKRVRSQYLPALQSMVVGACTCLQAATVESGFHSDFGPWEPLFSGEWMIHQDESGSFALLDVPGSYRPPLSRPRSYLFLPNHTWKDYSITLVGQSLEPPEVTRRDISILFGYADDTHYYYVHISSLADDTHNVIMKVMGDQRQPIHLETSPLPRLDGSLQTFRVEHESSGAIRVYVDDLEVPVMTALDTDYPVGAVAFGSFDDRARFDSVCISGTPVLPSATTLTIGKSPESMLQLQFPTQQGFSYQILSDTTLPAKTPDPITTTGSGLVAVRSIEPASEERRFFQVKTIHPLLATP